MCFVFQARNFKHASDSSTYPVSLSVRLSSVILSDFHSVSILETSQRVETTLWWPTWRPTWIQSPAEDESAKTHGKVFSQGSIREDCSLSEDWEKRLLSSPPLSASISPSENWSAAVRTVG